ncbi:amidase [Roseovarius sp. HI0049]|nr:amidase [Roseovarius sp. HI0049]
MSGKPVNLNRVRKDKARAQKRARSDENAVKFGRTKAEKARDSGAADKAGRHVDGHKRET